MGKVSGGFSSSYNWPSQKLQPANGEKNPAVIGKSCGSWTPFGFRKDLGAGSHSDQPLVGRRNRHKREREREWEPLRGVGGRVRQAHFRGSKWLLRSPRPRFPLMDGEAGASPDSPRTDSEDSDLRRRRDVEPLCSAPGFVLMLRMCCAETKSPPQGQPSVSTNLIT